MKIGAIEIGTNSTKMLIAEPQASSFKTIVKTNIVNRLSRNMYGLNQLSAESMEKGLQIVDEMIECCQQYGAELIAIFSTSVLRDAVNREAFIDPIRGKYGYNIEVISGEREGELAFKACATLAKDNRERFAIIDIGGGSTEVTIGAKQNIELKSSLDIGAVRLTEQFNIGDEPVAKETIDAILKHINFELKRLTIKDFDENHLIGVGGTVKTLGTIAAKLPYQNEDRIHGLKVTGEQVKEIAHLLAGKSLTQRRDTPGLNPKRADVIVVGLLILFTVMDHFNVPKITISSQGVLEGFITDYLEQKEQRTLFNHEEHEEQPS